MRERERQEVSRGEDCCAASPKSTGAGSPGALITRSSWGFLAGILVVWMVKLAPSWALFVFFPTCVQVLCINEESAVVSRPSLRTGAVFHRAT